MHCGKHLVAGPRTISPYLPLRKSKPDSSASTGQPCVSGEARGNFGQGFLPLEEEIALSAPGCYY